MVQRPGLCPRANGWPWPEEEESTRCYRSHSGDGWHFRFLPAQCQGCALADRADLRPTLAIDAVTPLEAINWGLVEQFARLEPTGQENPPPTLLARNVGVRGVRTVGKGKHLRLVVEEGAHGSVFDAVAFQQGEWAAHLAEGSRVDLAFQVEVNEWQGNRRLQLNVQDLRPSTA